MNIYCTHRKRCFETYLENELARSFPVCFFFKLFQNIYIQCVFERTHELLLGRNK